MNNERIDFVKRCSELLNIANPNLLSCELKLGKDIVDKYAKFGYPCIIPEYEYVVVT